jgi:hypothetical protein
MSHYLILFPYYFFLALCLLPALILLSRIARLKLEIHVLVAVSILLSITSLVVLLSYEEVSIEHMGAFPMLGLAGSSFLLAAVDAALARFLPLPLDEQLRAL